MKLEIILNILKEKQAEIKRSMEFNLAQLDKLPDYKDYYHREYLINYYQNILLEDIKKEIIEYANKD